MPDRSRMSRLYSDTRSNQIVLIVGSKGGTVLIPYSVCTKASDDGRWLDPAVPSSRDELTVMKGRGYRS
jgi:hypothetical protein